MHRDDDGIRKGVRGLDRIVGVHRDMEAPARLGGAGEQDDEGGRKPARDLGHAVVPDRIPGDIDRARVAIPAGQNEADDVARERLDAPPVRGGRALP